MHSAPEPLLAVGIDAADHRLIRRLADEGRLPAIARLMREGRWGRVVSPAPIGSGAVWPTFMTGEPPEHHGLFGEYAWDPEAMALRRPAFDVLQPFWARLADAGRTVLAVDVPFAPVLRRPRLTEVADWGAHDWLGGRPAVHPPAVAQALGDALTAPHPLVAGPVDSAGPGDVDGLRHVTASCASGARRRGDLTLRLLDEVNPDLALVVFTEAHRASHLLWHTIDRDHPAWREGVDALPDDVMRGLVQVFETIDEQIGRLAGSDAEDRDVVVFALHGMQPARGVPAFLNDVLEAWGFARERRWWTRSPAEHAASMAQAAKRCLPVSVKNAYYRRVPKSVTMQLAQPSVPVRAWDWSRTRAVSLPSDQHGWIRVNLQGRESRGIVPPGRYEAVCDDLRNRLLGLRSTEGQLVRNVIVSAHETGDPPRHLPDLIVHWTPLTWRARLSMVDPPLDAVPVGLKFVGQHDHDGFFVGRGHAIESWPEEVNARNFGRLLAGAIR